MFAAVGDRLVIEGQRLGELVRDAEILEVKHPDGGPPYLVRWADTGRESLVFPGPDATVHHFGRSCPATCGTAPARHTSHAEGGPHGQGPLPLTHHRPSDDAGGRADRAT
jgi:Domain of unknown function (DUF1918)